MNMQARILLFCGNVLLIIGNLLDTSVYPKGASYIKGMAGGVIIGALISFCFEWRAKREKKLITAEENNLTNL